MAKLRDLALSVPIIGGAFIYYMTPPIVCHMPTSPGAIHRVRLEVIAAAIDGYVMDEGHLPATLDDLPSPSQPDPGCIDADRRPRDDYRRDPDGVRVDYSIVDARSLRYRIAIPAHTTKAGAWVPNTHIEESAVPPNTPP